MYREFLIGDFWTGLRPKTPRPGGGGVAAFTVHRSAL